MPWQTPKTDWTKKDVMTPSVLNRIEANILELKKASTIDIEDSAGNFEATNVEDALQELAGNVTTGKTVVASAIYSMGQQADGSMTFAELAAKIRDISKDATAAPNDVLSGRTFYQGGLKRTGTMPNRGAVVITPGPTTKPIPAGYHNGEGYVATDPNLVPENIVQGKNIFGVEGAAWSNLWAKYGPTKTLVSVRLNRNYGHIALTGDGSYCVIGGSSTGGEQRYVALLKRTNDAWSVVYEGQLFPADTQGTGSFAWTPDGMYLIAPVRQLVSGSETRKVMLIKRVGDTLSIVSQITSPYNTGYYQFATCWDSTGTYCVVAIGGALSLVKRTGDEITFVSHRADGVMANLAADGGLRYIVSSQGPGTTLYLHERISEALTFRSQLSDNMCRTLAVAFSGNYVVGFGNQIRLFRRSGTTLTAIKTYDQFVSSAGTLPEASQIRTNSDNVFAVAQWNSSVAIPSAIGLWIDETTEDLRLIMVLPHLATRNLQAVYSDDGTRLAWLNQNAKYAYFMKVGE